MTWWQSQDDHRREAINTVLASERGQACRAYANSDHAFAAWLLVTDLICTRTTGVSIFDLADWGWRDAFEADVLPGEALREAVTADGLVAHGQ